MHKINEISEGVKVGL